LLCHIGVEQGEEIEYEEDEEKVEDKLNQN